MNSHLLSRKATTFFIIFVPVLPGEQWPSAMGFVVGDVGWFVLSLAVADITDERNDGPSTFSNNVSRLPSP